MRGFALKKTTIELRGHLPYVPGGVKPLALPDPVDRLFSDVVGIMDENRPIRTIRVHMALAEVTCNAIAEAADGDTRRCLDRAQ
jgi:hypothetical protein